MIISTKRQNYQLCHAGAYGNRIRQWDSIEAWRSSAYSDLVAMRVALPQPGGPKAFNLNPFEVEFVAKKWLETGITGDQIRISEMADGPRTLQGQYANDHTAEFLYTLETGPMPTALARSHSYAFGLRSRLLLQGHMTPASYADWQELLEQYPVHVLEVSIWESCLGDIPGRNAVVWEVRSY